MQCCGVARQVDCMAKTYLWRPQLQIVSVRAIRFCQSVVDVEVTTNKFVTRHYLYKSKLPPCVSDSIGV